MSAANSARIAYGQSPNTKSARDIEYEVFARVSRRLKAATNNTNAVGHSELLAAVLENRELWTALALDLAHPGNALSPTLRASLFYIAEFTLRECDLIAQGKGDPDILLELNTAVMRGLCSVQP